MSKNQAQAVAVQEENKQVVVQEKKETPRFLASDVVIPRMLLMQGQSDFVQERKAASGDIVRSTDVAKIGSPDKMLDFIALAAPSATWTIQVKAAGAKKWEFRRIEKRDASNDTLPWTFHSDKDGNEVTAGSRENTHEGRRVKVLSFFALLPQDIAAERAELEKAAKGEVPDLSKALMPILIAFRSTSYKAGKELTTLFAQAQKFNQKIYRYIVQLGCEMETKDDNSYYVFKVDRSKPTAVSAEDLPTVEYWANICEQQADSLKIDSTDEGDLEEAPKTNAAQQRAF